MSNNISNFMAIIGVTNDNIDLRDNISYTSKENIFNIQVTMSVNSLDHFGIGEHRSDSS